MAATTLRRGEGRYDRKRRQKGIGVVRNSEMGSQTVGREEAGVLSPQQAIGFAERYVAGYTDWILRLEPEHMRKILLSLGVALFGFGVVLILANVVMSYLGLSTSYNLGDPTRFQFFLVRFWHFGLAMAVIGAVCLMLWRRMAR